MWWFIDVPPCVSRVGAPGALSPDTQSISTKMKTKTAKGVQHASVKCLALVMAFSISASPAIAQFAASLIFRSGDAQVFANPGDVSAEAVLLSSGTIGVTLQLDGLLRYQFEQLTGAHLGDPLAVILCGQTLINPVVTDRISTGQVSLPAPSLDMAERIADVISGRKTCEHLDP